MLVDVFNMEGKKVKQVELPEAIFEAPINVDLMHQAFTCARWRMPAWVRMTPNCAVKLLAVVVKPWRQKGTGRARQGSIRAAQWGRWTYPHPASAQVQPGNASQNASCRLALGTVGKSSQKWNRDGG
jgi:large subunit ribosomal protein L4